MKQKISSVLTWLGIILIAAVAVRVVIWLVQGLLSLDVVLAIEIFTFGLILVVVAGFLSGQIKSKGDDKPQERVKVEQKSVEELIALRNKEEAKKQDDNDEEVVVQDKVVHPMRQDMLDILGEWVDFQDDNHVAERAKLACNSLRYYLDEKLPEYKDHIGEQEVSKISGSVDALACIEKLTYPEGSGVQMDTLGDIMYRLERVVFADKNRDIKPTEMECQLILALCISISKYISRYYPNESSKKASGEIDG